MPDISDVIERDPRACRPSQFADLKHAEAWVRERADIGGSKGDARAEAFDKIVTP